MSKTSIKTVLLVEDNLADAHSLREMLNQEGSYDTELTHVTCVSAAETHLAEHAVEIILRRDLKRYAGSTQPHRTSLWWCSRAWKTSP
jgi:CheY-like chemotaxis protein